MYSTIDICSISMESSKYILYADDDKDDLDIFEEAFKQFTSYSLMTFRNGIDLLAFIDLKAISHNIHLIISDINMPFLNGIETLRLLKSNGHSKNIPVCLYSTSANAMDKIIAETMNTKIFVKPFTLSAIKEVTESMLLECHEPIG